VQYIFLIIIYIQWLLLINKNELRGKFNMISKLMNKKKYKKFNKNKNKIKNNNKNKDKDKNNNNKNIRKQNWFL
jgi:hypothetical protein